jgi:hypothetical protein
MADVIGSRKSDQNELIQEFRKVTDNTNASCHRHFLSPITITLGDEFQAVAKNLLSAITIILNLEENIIALNGEFHLRYVLLEGKIETPINPAIAYGMLGSGLTKARETLTGMKKNKSRFHVILQDKALENALQNAFIALQGIIDDWRPDKDYYIVAKFLQNRDYKEVALELNKERSLIWKREKGLKLEEFFALKKVINYLGDNKDV